MENQTYFDKVLEKIYELPLWVKQAIYAELRDHIQDQTPLCSLETISKHNLLQLYTPFITINGAHLIKEESNELGLSLQSLTPDETKLLENANNKYRIIDICQTNSWNLGKTCKTLTTLIEKNLIEPVTSNAISSTLYFLAGKIRIGEFLVRTGKITVEQLDMALYSQQYTEDTVGERIYLAQILLNLNYISPKDYENLIFLKDYGHEIYGSSFNENISDVDNNITNLKKEITFLKTERLKLKENLTKFSDDAQTIASLLERIDDLKNGLDTIKKEHQQAQNDLNFYLDEVVSLSQENFELREKIQD